MQIGKAFRGPFHLAPEASLVFVRAEVGNSSVLGSSVIENTLGK